MLSAIGKPRIAGLILLAAVMLSVAAFGQNEGNVSAPPAAVQGNAPPIEQALVPEGVFAMQLAEGLKLGAADDEAKAENLLGNAGIEPKNGWISEYPITPAVIGDIEKGVANAADQGRLSINKEQALKTLDEVKTKLGLPVGSGAAPPASPATRPANTTIYSYTDKDGVIHYTDQFDSIPNEYRATAKTFRKFSPYEPPTPGSAAGEGPSPLAEYPPGLSPEAVDRYYYDEGPPTITYYPPPDPYDYLYSWVPYPFWSTGFYFPGFFILRNFHRHVFVGRHPFIVSSHLGNLGFRKAAGFGPVGAPIAGGQAPPHPVPAQGWYTSAGALAGAHAIMARPGPGGMPLGRRNLAALPNRRIAPTLSAPINRPVRLPAGSFRPHFGPSFSNQPAFRPRPLTPMPPAFAPRFGPSHGFVSPHAFNRGPLGGFHGGGRAPGGFHGGGFGGHGGGRR